MMKKKISYSAILAVPLIAVLIFFLGGAANATFNANNLIDDSVFDAYSSMTASQIDSFLNSFPSSCISPSNGFSTIDPTGYSPGGGFTYGSHVSAGAAIYDAAQAYGLNPKVILTTLQKEQSLVTGTSGCSTLRYTGAMGYGCPDGGTTHDYSGVDLYAINGVTVTSVTGTCVNTSLKAGFSQQIIRGAWLLKFGEQRSEGNTGWAENHGNWDNSDDPPSCYGGPMTQGYRARSNSANGCGGSQDNVAVYYDGYTTIDGSSTHMDNGATAALYWYTPHFSGNQSFVTIYTTWFGSTTDDPFAWQIIQDPTNSSNLYLVAGNTRYYIPGPSICTAWGFDCSNSNQVSTYYFNSLSAGPNVNYVGLDIYGRRFLMSAGKKYYFPSDQMVLTWGVAGIAHISAPGYVYQMTYGGPITQFAQDSSDSKVYLMNGTTRHLGVGGSSLSYWGYTGSNATVVTDDIVTRLSLGSNIDRYVSIGGKDEIMDNSGFYTFANSNIESAWGNNTYVSIPGYASALYPTQPVGTFVRASNDSRWYYLEAGNTHYVTPEVLPLWGWGSSNPLTIISPSLLTSFTSSSALGYLAKNSSGSQYLIDGAKHLISSSLVTPVEGATSVPTFSDQSLSLLPTSSTINSDVVSFSGNAHIYAFDNGALRGIPSYNALSAFGAFRNNPIANLNGSVLKAMPVGSNVDFVVKDSLGNSYYLDNGSFYSIDSSFLNTWQSTTAPVIDSSTLTLMTNSGKTIKQAVSINGRDYIVNNRSLIDVTNDYQNFGLTSTDFISVSQQSMPILSSSYLVGTPGSNKIWLLSMGQRYYIPSYGLLSDLGYGSRTGILSLNSDNIATLPENASQATRLIRASGGGVIFTINGNGYGFKDSTTFNAYCGASCTVLTEPVADFQKLSFTGWTSQIIYGTDGKIYYVNSGQKQWIANPDLLNTRYAGLDWFNMPQYVIDAFPTGATITN